MIKQQIQNFIYTLVSILTILSWNKMIFSLFPKEENKSNYNILKIVLISTIYGIGIKNWLKLTKLFFIN